MTNPAIDNDAGGARVVQTPAKINLFLLVGGKRKDGYHPICSLMEKVSLYDHVSVRRTGRAGVRIIGSEIPAPGNTVFRAAAALEEETGVTLDIEVTLDKRIPQAGGLAGGSSDAAAVLELLDGMYGLGVPSARLAEIALGIGADVPFFLLPGPMVAEGAGELLSPAPGLPDYHTVVVKPETGLATADVYELYDSVAAKAAAAFPQRRRELLERLGTLGDSIDELARLMANDLEIPAAQLCPDIVPVKKELLSLGAAGAMMSGSGPSVFGLFAAEEAAAAAQRQLARRYPGVWLTRPHRS